MAVVITPNMALSQQLRTGGGRNKPIIGWDNAVSTSILAASSEAEGYPVVNLSNPSTASEWRAADISGQYLMIQSLSVSTFDYIGIARHNLGSIGANVRVSALTTSTPPEWNTVFEDTVLPDDSPAVLRFDPVETSVLLIEFGTAPTSPPRIAVLYAGQATVVAGGMYQEVVPIPYGYQTDIVTNRAESGDFLGRIVTDQRLQLAYEFAYVEYDWFKANMGPFIKNAMLQPFFFAWLPEMYPEDVAFGWLTADINPISENFEGTIVVRFNMEMGGLTV